MNFDQAFTETVGVEGQFQCLYNDSGNWTGGKVGAGLLKGTKYGISAASYPALDIKNLTIDQAKAIYKRDFWDVLNFDVYNIPDIVRFDLFDVSVQTCAPGHPKVAWVMLQKALNVSPDGIIGPMTIAAIKAIDPQVLDKRLTAQKILYLTKVSPEKWQAFGKGWMNRFANNLMVD